MSSYRTIQTAKIASKGKMITIEIALTEEGLFVVIGNGLWDGKSHHTEPAARAVAIRLWNYIRSAEAAA